ncbi:nucleotide-binding universal stress UspA family protein [Albidovulum inexpectatum]|uniref:Nucleotide-binding universal stress UspA family protein n=1 Tax=Albidovulum inexpectatum TaxID=196587 RepID=A0A2S5JHI3_9RHOB|nr:universal stress protein [Albidovulum inexpectatum]PPB80755.1 nucleotide-binding universal stress UspA family protein [Albidovulum inexpectatum]
MKDILVAAYDGSAASRRAVDFAIRQAGLIDASVVIAHVLEWSPYSFLTPQEIAERHKRRAEELARAQNALIDPLLKELGDAGVPVSAEVRYGHVAETICQIAKEARAGQVFVGRTGESRLAQRLFGSVAVTLAQISPVACTIVP